MKNIHVISTDTLSRLGRFIDTNNLFLRTYNDIPRGENVHIYITDDEDIKEGDWFIRGDEIHKCFSVYKTDIEFLTSIDSVYCGSNTFWNKEYCKKIILTTDEDLIQYGVQAIDDDFLQWFVNNPNCEEVEIKSDWEFLGDDYRRGGEQTLVYKIIIPSEEPNYNMKQEIIDEMERLKVETKQEKLEEREPYWDLVDKKAEENNSIDLDVYAKGVQDGVKYMQKQMYRDEDLREALFYALYLPRTDGVIVNTNESIVRETIAKFKKK
jgi:hypothetical protein